MDYEKKYIKYKNKYLKLKNQKGGFINFGNETNIIEEENNGHKIYYFDNDWQKPVITEYQVFKLFKENKNIPMNYFAFPWATMIDNFDKKDKKYYDMLSNYKLNDGNKCFTVMQHIYYKKYLELVKKIGITHVVTPHKSTDYKELENKYGIKIIAFSLYPVQHYNYQYGALSNINDRKYLTSFLGQYDNPYNLSDIRKKIIDIFSKYDDCLIKGRKEWHFDGIVYRNEKKENNENKDEYIKNLLETKFSLCPSGTGPNSIRLWESMSYGTIPIILADTLVLPEISGINWKDYLIIWEESNVDNLYNYLYNMEPKLLEKLSQNCIKLFNEYFVPEKMTKIIIENIKDEL